MTTYYVASTGSDLSDGSDNNPFLTVQHAIDIASNGDTIIIKDSISSNSTININKELTITGIIGVGELLKSQAGDCLFIQSSNVTISNLIIIKNASNATDANISIDRASNGEVPPTIYNNINITNNTISMHKCGISVNGSNVTISGNTFIRCCGNNTLTVINVYNSNGLTISNNTVTDTKQTDKFVNLTKSGTIGSTYFNECNTKSGTMIVNQNVCNCSSNSQNFTFLYQDSFIGSQLILDIFDNDINVSIAGKLYEAYVSTASDLTSINTVVIHSNDVNLSTSGLVNIDAGSSVTLPTDLKFIVYSNTQQNFTLGSGKTGNSDFTQTTATVFPANLHLSSIVQYTTPSFQDTATNSGNNVEISSRDISLNVAIESIIEDGFKYCNPIVYYGSVIDLNLTSLYQMSLSFTVPDANPDHNIFIYKQEITPNAGGYPIACNYIGNNTWTANVPSTENVSCIDVNAVGQPI